MKEPIPLIDLKLQYNTIRDEVNEAINRVLNSQRFILGDEVSKFEKEISQYCQVKHSIGVSSGTDALLLALMAIDIKPGDEVITSSYSFFATAGSIARLGAKPVFVDIEPKTYNIDPNKIEQAINKNTKAIIPVHLFGNIADMKSINELAHSNKLHVIEDACQAIGADLGGKKAGSLGSIGCFSFFPTKNLGGYGDGGLITTNNDELANKISSLRNHGFSTKYHSEFIGGNFRLDAIQAAILSVKLKHLDNWTLLRRQNAAKYRELFTDQMHINNINSDNKINLPFENNQSKHVYNQFVIKASKRDDLQTYLKYNSIGSEIYYPIPLHKQPCFSPNNIKLPESELASTQTLGLPIFPELTESNIKTIVNTISQFYS